MGLWGNEGAQGGLGEKKVKMIKKKYTIHAWNSPKKKKTFILKRIPVETQFSKATLVFLASDDDIRGVSTWNNTRGFLETSSLSCLGYGSNISENLSNIFSVCILYSNYTSIFKKHQKYGRLNKEGEITGWVNRPGHGD